MVAKMIIKQSKQVAFVAQKLACDGAVFCDNLLVLARILGRYFKMELHARLELMAKGPAKAAKRWMRKVADACRGKNV